MFARLAFLVVCLGLIGTSLLALRQARLQAASEAAQAQLRIASADEELFSVRAQVAATVTPSAVEKLASSMHPMRPATNDIPTALAMEELKGLPEVLGGLPAHQLTRQPTPQVEDDVQPQASTKPQSKKPTFKPTKKPQSPRVAHSN